MSETKKKQRTVVSSEKGIYKAYSDNTILLENVIASYPYLGFPQKRKSDKGVESDDYAITCMLPKATHRAAVQACSDRIKKLEAQMAAKGHGKGGKFKYPVSRRCLKNGDAKDEDGDSLFPNNPEYADHFILVTHTGDQPQLRGRKADPETGKPERLTNTQAKNMIYGGAIVSVLVDIWPQDHVEYGTRANAKALAVQWRAKGERIGGDNRVSEDDIEDSLEADDEDADSGGWDDDDDDAPL